MPKPDEAKWIWVARARHSEDSYVRARRTFRIRGRPLSAALRITAFSEYSLYVNGRYVGSGPAPSSAASAQVDVYTQADLGLVRGVNVLAVLAHNYYVGLPRLPRLPGGLWARLDVTTASGKVETVVTDRRWRMCVAEDFSGRAPRIYWTAGFAEVRDTRREHPGWTSARFDDRRWRCADEVSYDRPEGPGRLRLVERSAARLEETFRRPMAVTARGRVVMPRGVTAVPFEFAVPDPAHGEFYAATFVRTRQRRKVRLVFDCDEAAAVYLNNRQVLRQGYDEGFIHWLADDEHDEYTGIHRGQGSRAESAAVVLDAGWNSLGVVIYDPGTAWGFAMRLEDPHTGDPLPLLFSPEMRSSGLAHWSIVCEELCPCGKGAIPETPGPNSRTFPDPAYQLSWERRCRRRGAAAGAESLLADLRTGGPCVLRDGEFAAFDFGEELVGRIEIEVEGAPGAILDLAWSEGLGPAGRLEPVRRGMRQADRLILRGGRQTVRFFGRRALRYLELVARTGDARGPIRVRRLGLYASAQPAPSGGVWSAGRPLAKAIALADRTVRCCLQQTLEGTPGREAEQSLPAAWHLARAERLFYGRTTLGEAALRAFAADQGDDGFLRAIVPSGTVYCVPDWSLLWVIWLAEHVAWSGDRRLARDLYPAAEKCLEWTSQFRGPSGLLENRGQRRPWWLFLDLSPMDKRGEVTAWQALYVRALEAAAEVAELLGLEDAATHNRSEAAEIVRTARQRLWDDGRGLFVDARKFDQLSPSASPAANAYVLYGRLASPEQADRIIASLWTDRRQPADWGPCENPYVKYFALEALLERGRADLALNMIRTYWASMADAGLATVPEAFPVPEWRAGAPTDGRAEGPYVRPPPTALCHGWGAYVSALVARWVLGVYPAGPGFEPLGLSPMPAGLTGGGRVWTPRGQVEVDIVCQGDHHMVRVRVPEGMPYRLDRSRLGDADVVEVSGGRPV